MTKTRILSSSDANITLAVERLKEGYPVAIPTETVYGLAANCMNPLASSRIFQVKNRPTDNPLICHVSSYEMLDMLVAKDENGKLRITNEALTVMKHFWPGPLTVLLPKNDQVSDIVSAGLPTVAVRFPSHPIVQKIIELAGFPLAAPSANLSGRPSPTTAQHVLDDLDGRIAYIVDGGPSSFGLESTVLDATSNPPIILRPGAITASMLKPYMPSIQVYGMDKRDLSMEERPSTPGMKYKHYAPTAPVKLVKAYIHMEENVARFLSEHKNDKFVRLCIGERPDYANCANLYLTKTSNLAEIARNLFNLLREADLLSPSVILAEEVSEEEEGLAIMNRLGKAATSVLS